ncbi:Nuclear poly(A) polymerase 3 [Hibiscus syriacus]|uniref:polynucleotide adenylyltransferase n=1 Tax=Hibiscus syriacus TaxID=106335 RepID=A0A6A3AL95_HIBSY|nr:Nuclear poly(A) polymerase 3 [Hibiscus syriacus]
MDDEKSSSLLQLMVNEGLVPSPEEEERRRNVIENLKKIVMAWAKRVAWQRRLPKQDIASCNATLLTYGSYGLGLLCVDTKEYILETTWERSRFRQNDARTVHGSESDIDALCIGPYFATMAEDFFIVLYNMLKSRPEISEIHRVKDAKVPLMRFEFDGISIDLPYVQLKVLAVPENLDIFDPLFLRDIDETGWKSLSGVCANRRICQLVPNLEKFQSMLRCVKFWAKRRGVYGNLNGFLGGIHLAILAAFVCQYKRLFIPIRLPFSPYEYCHSNITRSTFYKIRAEFLRGHSFTKDLLKSYFDWHNVLEPFPYTKKYTRFLKIYLSASKQDELGDWLEEVQGICDPNPAEYNDIDTAKPNVVFYWGLQPGKSNAIDTGSVKDVFWRNICTGYQGPFGEMELSVVQASQLPKCAQSETVNRKGMKACWKIIDYDQQRIPIYSQHLPHYVVGYISTNGDP